MQISIPLRIFTGSSVKVKNTLLISTELKIVKYVKETVKVTKTLVYKLELD